MYYYYNIIIIIIISSSVCWSLQSAETSGQYLSWETCAAPRSPSCVPAAAAHSSGGGSSTVLTSLPSLTAGASPGPASQAVGRALLSQGPRAAQGQGAHSLLLLMERCVLPGSSCQEARQAPRAPRPAPGPASFPEPRPSPPPAAPAGEVGHPTVAQGSATFPACLSGGWEPSTLTLRKVQRASRP